MISKSSWYRQNCIFWHRSFREALFPGPNDYGGRQHKSPLVQRTKLYYTLLMSTIIHPFPPLYNAESRILILGSFPSVKSREQQFFYGHPQNRFWKLMALLYCGPDAKPPQTIEEKRALILKNHLALYDTIYSCEIVGSSDSSIRNAVPTDLSPILSGSPIEKILCNGTKSFELYQKYQYPRTGIPAVRLPSTSPANAAWSMEKLKEAWSRHCITIPRPVTAASRP